MSGAFAFAAPRDVAGDSSEGDQNEQHVSRPDRERKMRTALLTLATVLVVSGCGGASTTDGGGATGSTRAWGPLAVTRADEVGMEALTQGTLRVTDECVLLDEQGEEVLLVWNAGQTTWNADERTITFRDQDGTVTVRDGDQLRLGGGGSSIDEGGAAPEEWAAGIDWVSAPAPGCLKGARWSVDDLEKVPGS